MSATSPTSPKKIRFTPLQLSSGVLVLTLLVAIALHFRLHAALLNNPWPITVRESAFILQTEALLDPSAPAQYSKESVPLDINLYGPLYPLFAAPFVSVIPDEPYLAHRIATGLCLVLTCLLLAWSAAKQGGRLAGFAAAGIFYCATIASPSPAAGPDNLATLFYVAAIIWVRHLGCGAAGLLGGTALGFLALMTKPYAVWVLPCLLVYVAWRHSLRRGALFGGALLIAGLCWAWGANLVWPEYFFSVFLVHAQSATRLFSLLRDQVFEFSYLNFAPLLLVALFTPWRRLWQMALAWRWTQAHTVEDADHSKLWPLYMSFAAAAPLLLSMGWHGGAYIIYFNHLLLAPLLLAAFDLARRDAPQGRRRFADLLTTGNALLLIVLLPSMPSTPNELELPPGEPILVDPLLEPLRRSGMKMDVVDNAQAEYWISNAIRRGTPEQNAAALAWERSINEKIASGYYSTIILASPGFYNRRVLWNVHGVSPIFDSNYALVGRYSVDFYYAPFQHRTKFGRYPLPLFVFARKNPAPASTKP